jgi:HEAT repeat protein
VKYQNFTLRAEKTASKLGAISVQVLFSPAGEQRQPEYIDAISELKLRQDLESNTRKLENRNLKKNLIIELGQKLADLLLPPRTRSMFEQSWSSVKERQEGLRLQLRLDAELSKYPWEYLYLQRGNGEPDDTGFLALHPSISIVRYEEVDQRVDRPKADLSDPLRLFVGLSSPDDERLLDLGQEQENITTALSTIDKIHVEFKPATLETLRQSIRAGLDIFHFVGHGGFYPSKEQGCLVLVDAENGSQLVTAEEVATLLQGWGVQLVFLGACETGRRDGENIWNSVVTALMRVGIPSAIAMQYTIFDRGAIAFSDAFYQAVVKGCSLDEAVLAGRQALFDLCNQGQDQYWRDWGVIVLYSRVQDDVTLLPDHTRDNSDTISKAAWLEACQAWLEGQERFRSTQNPPIYCNLIPGNYVPIWLKTEKRSTTERPQSDALLYPTWDAPLLPTIAQVEWLKQILSTKWVAIIGEPGSGKSSLLQQTAQWLFNQQGQVALWVSLADIQGETLEAYLLEKWLKLVLPTVAPQAATVTAAIRNEFIKLVRTDRFWLLLDGLDELSLGTTDRLVGVISQLQQLMGMRPAAHVILTCRSSFWDAEKAANWFDTYCILEFNHTPDRNQVQDFITQWAWRRPQQGQDLQALLNQQKYQPLKDLVKNPLRLALVCHLWQSDATLPNTLTDLYRRFVQILCRQSNDAEMQQPDKRDELNQALGRLAIAATDESETQLYLRRQWVEDRLGSSRWVEVCLHLGWLCRVEKTVNAPEEEFFSFPHAVFQDYFAAQAIGDNWRWFFQPNPHSSATARVFESHWQTVISLWLEQSEDQSRSISMQTRQEFITALVDFKAQNDNIFQTCTLFTASCLVAANLTADPLASKLHQQLVEIYRTTPYLWLKEQTFSALQHLSQSELFQFLQEELASSNSEHYFKAIQALGDLGSDRAIEQLFEQYLDKGDDSRLILSILLKMPTDQAKQTAEQILNALLQDRSQLPSTLTHLIQLYPSTVIHWFITKFQDLQVPRWVKSLAMPLLGHVNRPEVETFWQQQLQQILDHPQPDRMALLNTINAIQIPLDPVLLDRLQGFAQSLDIDLCWAITRFLGQQRRLTWREVLHCFPPDSHPTQREQIFTLLAQYQDPEAEIQVIQFSRTTYAASAIPRQLIVVLGQFGSVTSFQYLSEQFQFLANAPMGDVEKEQVMVQSLYQISQRSPHFDSEAPSFCGDLLRVLRRDPNLDEDFISAVVSLIFQFAQAHEIQTFLQLIQLDNSDLKFQIGYACLRFLEQKSNVTDRHLPIVQQAIEAANISDATISDSGLAQAYLKLKMRAKSSEETASLLQAAIHSDNSFLCREAIELGLAALSPGQMTTLLVPLLQHPEQRVVEKAIAALGSLGSAEHLTELFLYRKDYDAFLQEEAYKAILKIAKCHQLLGHVRLRLNSTSSTSGSEERINKL